MGNQATVPEAPTEAVPLRRGDHPALRRCSEPTEAEFCVRTELDRLATELDIRARADIRASACPGGQGCSVADRLNRLRFYCSLAEEHVRDHERSFTGVEFATLMRHVERMEACMDALTQMTEAAERPAKRPSPMR